MTEMNMLTIDIEKYKDDPDYYQVLNTAMLDLGLYEFYKLLENAESEGKKISISLTKAQENIVANGGSVDGGYSYALK